MERRHKNVVNVAEVEAAPMANGRFTHTDRRLAMAAGAKQLGCSHYEVPPGKTAFPCHFHCANEEAIFILEGEGTARIGPDKVAVKAGDFIAMPTGPEHAHQLLNTGTATLKYLAFSTMHTTEVVGYPDSKKLAARAAGSVAEAFAKPWVRHIWKEAPPVDYFEGEDV